MRAAVVTVPDTSPVCGDFPEPTVPPGHEPLHLVGAGLHNIVRGLATGGHYSHGQLTYPLVPGIDAVARTGDGCLVYTGYARPPFGTMAERLVAPFQAEVPAGADPLAIAAGMNPALSGWMVLTSRRKEMGALSTVLVLGATGISGSLAVQGALALGAERVIAAGRDPEALEQLRGAGATPVSLAHDGPDGMEKALADAVSETSPGLVLDYLWGPVAEAAFAVLGRSGEDTEANTAYVQIGSLAGSKASLPADLLRSRRIRVTGSGVGSRSAEEMLAEAPEVMARFADGSLQLPYTAFPLSRVGEAWAHTGRSRAVVVPD
ncbi:zinc-binding alcohol dehydrogenase family protein [Nonomuraea glycinis]|uniref:NADPH:quinone reductase n=1 Tax=Nonomuraea glycinis TaxID=2047744 RepID=A0A918A0J4_9ACTN|nr:zinc-binding alcohol dehydrogenase family protein [Nonomuraea glycinis]MCA2182143.1 zinc-binding alcohol dehydrogenase family protein [Nonomuraea glycinis]GGP02209.1 NADPH:quinone reductase [Nonomuraea glycinis]